MVWPFIETGLHEEMDHAIVVANADGTITWWSPGAEVLFGDNAAAAVGLS